MRHQYGRIWEHPTRDIWIVFYPETWARTAHYQAYRSVNHSPSRRIGEETGFGTLDDALSAVKEACE